MSASTNKESKEWVLGAGEELRFEVAFKKTVQVRLKSGNAEYFGTELGPEAVYQFSGTNGAIFSWQGCTLVITGECESAYVAEETPMDMFANVHMALQQLRVQARNTDLKAAPRVMIVGPDDSGKTSLARLLLSYAARMGERPLFVSLDPLEASVSMPSTISATLIDKPIAIESGFMGYAQSSSHGQTETPLVLQYGYEQPEDNATLFNMLTDKLAAAINRRLDTEKNASGIIVDTRGFSDVARNKTIEHAIASLGINTLLVVGNERMFSVYSNKLRSITVLKLPRSGGTVDRSASFRQQQNSRIVRQYFYGTDSQKASSFSTVVNFQEIKILRVGEDAIAPTSTLPLGEDRKLTDTTVLSVEPDESLIHSILAVTDAPLESVQEDSMDVDGEKSVVGIQAVGFISVTKIEMDKKRMIVLSPVPGRLPKQVLLYGNAKWMETI
ncbi:Cleavage polyadenylation factor subunit clp1 [Coemansia brasiliensis]|uniref:Polynucleotide 5'-hydroxyl-kinase GRC3 n=1 Tax=Coemansia brasiliensis TaxID=2650707 RepID=A0A9W8IFK9_9FUNG|nr:Cleavage polyadenylation factor subunit clp1 [Coemansia brasiliensis]